MTAASPAPPTLRLDRLLWQLRLTRTRSAAQAIIAAGHVRVDSRRVDKPAHPVRAGAVLTLPLPGGVRVLHILALPDRRGPAPEAALCYKDITGPARASK